MRRRNQPRSQHQRTRIKPPEKPRLALIGFRGVGKSAIARRLSEFWQMPHLALDEAIEKNQGNRIDEIVRQHGWQYFRDLEYEALRQASQESRLLLDCGGGIIEEADGLRSNRKMQILQEKFFCIYIAMSEDKLRQRFQILARNPSRPALTSADNPDELLKIFRRREPLYLEIAHVVVDVSDTNVPDSAVRIAQMFK
jgi:shikimate kinase